MHRLVFARLARLRGALEAHARNAELPQSRVVELDSDDELGRLDALFRRVMFPARPDPERPERGAAPQPPPRDVADRNR